MGGLLLGTFELPLSIQIEDQPALYDSTEGDAFPFTDTSSRRQNDSQVWRFRLEAKWTHFWSLLEWKSSERRFSARSQTSWEEEGLIRMLGYETRPAFKIIVETGLPKTCRIPRLRKEWVRVINKAKHHPVVCMWWRLGLWSGGFKVKLLDASRVIDLQSLVLDLLSHLLACQ